MNFNRVALAVFAGWAGMSLPALSSPSSAAEFKTVLEWDAEAVRWDLIGGSLIKNGKLAENAKFQIKFEAPAGWETKVYLLWSGEVAELNGQSSEVRLSAGSSVSPKASAHLVKSQFLWTERSTGFIYTAVSDVTDIIRGSKGPWTLSGLRSDPVDFAQGSGYSQAGWALLSVARKGASGPSRIVFLGGAEPVAPGEPQDVLLYKGSREARLVRLGIAGGHGIAGNGGGTLVNGKSVSGGDDWTGASGELWDVRRYDLKNQSPSAQSTVTFDSLLQWIFPSCVVGEFLL